MSSPLRDHKSLSDWVELDYFRRPRGLRRRRRRLIWLSVVVGAVGLVLLLRPGSHSLHQAGPLSTGHAMFSNACGKCHEEFLNPARRFLTQDATLRTVKDSTCKQCHSAPPHHANAEMAACASCHREHRGHDRLARVTDFQCLSCHADLPANTKTDGAKHPPVAGPPAPKPPPAPPRDIAKDPFRNVTGFVGDEHPEFFSSPRGAGKDPGALKFTHYAHLRQDGVVARGPKGALQCTDCHEPDSERRYLKPVNYTSHCAQCHPLSVQVVGEFTDVAARKEALAFARKPAPHKEAPEVLDALRGRFAIFADRHRAVLEPPPSDAPERQLPGKPAPAGPPAEEKPWVAYQVERAERLLFDLGGGCRLCHEAKGVRKPGELPAYLPTDVPERWYPHSFFRHNSHRMMRCVECHVNARTSRTARDVLMPTRDTCQQCHNPQVGARTDCVECHRYHDRAGARDLQGQWTLDKILGRNHSEK